MLYQVLACMLACNRQFFPFVWGVYTKFGNDEEFFRHAQVASL